MFDAVYEFGAGEAITQRCRLAIVNGGLGMVGGWGEVGGGWRRLAEVGGRLGYLSKDCHVNFEMRPADIQWWAIKFGPLK